MNDMRTQFAGWQVEYYADQRNHTIEGQQGAFSTLDAIAEVFIYERSTDEMYGRDVPEEQLRERGV